MVVLQKVVQEFRCSAENKFLWTFEHVINGKVTTKYKVRIPDGTERNRPSIRPSGNQSDLGNI